jgi:hypothetical protein
MAETENITLFDGTRVKIPTGLSDGEITNLVARSFPDKMTELGISHDIEREYDIRSGVGDFSARFGNALAGGNPEEVKAEFDNIFGQGNWGFTDFSGEPYVTPAGLRAVGIEPKDDRKVLLDGTSSTVYDLVDIIPEAVVGAGAVAAELIPIPGTSVAGATATRGLLSFLTSRGLVARSARAGMGDAAANVGLEGVQKIRGTQRESLGEVLQEAGTEGLVVGLGSIVLGAPYRAVGGVANRVRSASKDMTPDTQGVHPPLITEMIAAKNRIAEHPEIGEEGALLLSLRTLIGDQGLVAGNILTKIEGVGAKQMGDSFAKRTMDFMNKYRSVVLESKRLKDDDLTTLAKLRSTLSKSEQRFAARIIKELEGFNNSKLGKIGIAGETLRGFKDLAQQKLLRQYRRSMKEFDKPEFYGQFKNMTRVLSSDELASFIRRVADESGLGIDNTLNILTRAGGSATGGRIRSRVKISDDGSISGVQLNKKQQALKDAGKDHKTPHTGSDLTVQDMFDLDKAVRKQAYSRRADVQTARSNLETSSAVQEALVDYAPTGFKQELKRVNKIYSNFAKIYRGKEGLFQQITKKGTDDPQTYLEGFVKGSDGAELVTLLQKLDNAFGENALGGSIGLETKQQILGALGVNYIREGKQGVLSAMGRSAVEGAEEAGRALKAINSIEDTISKRLGSVKAKEVMKELFGLQSVKEYKSLLNRIHKGGPESSAKAAAELGTVLSFKEADDFIKRMGEIGSDLKNSDLDAAVAGLKRLEAIDKRSGVFYRDLMFSENWGRVVSAMTKDSAAEKNLAIKAWADDWIDARTGVNGVENMKELFGKEVYQAMDDLALNIRGALNIDPNSGALSVAEQPVSLLRRLMRGDFTGALKPLSFIYGSKQFGPGSPVWSRMSRRLEAGQSPNDILKSESVKGRAAANSVTKAVNGALTGRNGLFAASVSSYMNEADQVYPTEDEAPVVAPQKIEEETTAVQEQQVENTIPTDTGLAAIQKIANMIQNSNVPVSNVAGTGVSNIELGASMAK